MKVLFPILPISLLFLLGCAGTQLNQSKVELEHSKIEQTSVLAFGVSDSLTLGRMVEAESSWVKAERAWPWQKEAMLRRMRAELLLERVRLQVLAEHLRFEQAQFKVNTQQALYQEAELLSKESGAQVQLDTSYTVAPVVIKQAIEPYQMQWSVIAVDWKDSLPYADTLKSRVQQWSSLRARRMALENKAVALQNGTAKHRLFWLDYAREKMRQGAEREAALSDTLFSQKRIWQQKFEDLLQKATNREFLKDQLYITLNELRGVADTAVAKITSCRQSFEALSLKAESAQNSFLGLAVLGLRGVAFEDGRYILSSDRTEILDKSLEILGVYWPGSRIDVVHWVDTNAFSAETTLVADMVARRNSYLINRMEQSRANPKDSTRIQLRGCVRHIPSLVQDLNQIKQDSLPIDSQSIQLTLPNRDTASIRSIHSYGDISLVLTGPRLPESLTMDSASVCSDAELALLRRGAIPKPVVIDSVPPPQAELPNKPSATKPKAQTGVKAPANKKAVQAK